MGRAHINKEKPSSAVKMRCLANAKINNMELFGAYTSFLQLAAHRIRLHHAPKTLQRQISAVPFLRKRSISTEQLNEQYKETEAIQD